MKVLLAPLGMPQAEFRAFPHFMVAIPDALRVPLKTIQERLGHAVTGWFTLDVYGGKPERDWDPEVARTAGTELGKAIFRS